MKKYVLNPGSDARSAPKRVALVRSETPARVLEDRQEVVPTAPHLLLREVILVQLVVVAVAICALAVDAPLEGIADPYHTPNPAKAPWYFLGLQELLHYFPPVVAGVLVPALVVVALVVIPYFRVNIETTGLYEGPWRWRVTALGIATLALSAILVHRHVWPVLVPTVVIWALLMTPALPVCPAALRRRLGAVPVADWIMLWFVVVSVTLTVIGVLFRGPGWSFVLPWRDGRF